MAAAAAAAAAAAVGHALGGAVLGGYHWLAAHPYVAVIGGMALYLAVLLSFSRWACCRDAPLAHEQLRRQFELLQRLQHARRLRAWEQRHPEQARAQQQQQRQQHSAEGGAGAAQRWGGMMGFGPQAVPEEEGQRGGGCRGAVREVLEAMDFYEVLGVPWGGATPAALRAARRARALAVHPDKVGRATPGAALAGSRVNAAFATLSDPRARQQYDEWLSKQS